MAHKCEWHCTHGLRCEYADMDWYCVELYGHDGPHRSEVLQPLRSVGLVGVEQDEKA